MGKSTSSAPAPDPRLIDAQIRSMGVQDGAIERIIKNSDRFLPLQELQLTRAMDAQQRASEENAQDRGYALKKRAQLDSAQAPLLRMANEFSEGERRDDLYGEASADIDQAFSGALEQGSRNFSRMGVRPTDGIRAAFVQRTRSDAALARAIAGRKVTEAARLEGFNLRRGAADMLAGFPGMASGLTSSGFGYGSAGVGIANASLASMNSGYGTAAGVAGQMGQNATSMFGAQASYKNAQDQIQTQNDPMQTVLGAAAGAGMGWGLNKLFPKQTGS